MNKQYDFIAGEVLAIDKALEWTSFDVVNKLRYELKKKLKIKKIKVGHAGTLDPLATGLLLVCTGKMTKRISEFQEMEKEYTGTFTLGATTPSYDLETEIDRTFPTDHLTEELIREKSRQFIGTIEQLPPEYSAIKVEGKRAYEFAREGKEVKMQSRKVHISSFETALADNNQVEFKVSCSKGTYIRSLARDLGKALGCGAHLSELRRTAIGDFRVEEAMPLAELVSSLAESSNDRMYKDIS